VYQIIGAFIRSYTQAETGGDFNENSYAAYDLTGTKVVSVPNAAGVCQPIAVFSGSSGTGITCKPLLHGADESMYQQAYPTQAWGTRYLTAPLASQNSNTEYLFNTYRVLVKDVNTVVKRNGVTLTGRTGNYYEFTSRDAEYIEADRPVMVGQYMTYFNACGNDEYDNPGSNESMVYLTPLGYGVKESVFFTKKKNYSFENNVKTYLTVIVPDGGFTSLKVDGVHSFDLQYPHPQLAGYTVAMKMYDDVETVAHVTCDTAFTALYHVPNNIYGLVNNAGFRVPRVGFDQPSYRNVYSQLTQANTYTCVNAPFTPKVYLPVAATSLTWKFSAVTGATPASDVTIGSPAATDTIIRDNRVYYGYLLNQEVRLTQTGNVAIPVTASYSEDPATCNATVTDTFRVTVIAAPVVSYTTDYTGCINANGNFTGDGTAGNGAVLNRWNWNFGDNATATGKTVTKQYSMAATYTATLTAIANDGCIGSASKQITVIPLPSIEVVNNNIGTCPGSAVTFTIKDPAADVVYTWYNQPAAGSLLGTGTSYTTSVASATQFYVNASRSGCNATTRVAVTAYIIPDVAAPLVTADSVGVHAVRFSWNAVPNATGYEVSADNGATWTVPSSGSTGLSHVISSLQPKQQVTLLVRSLGGCQLRISQVTAATTLSDAVFVPNSFSPNGDGLNDVIRVYGADIKTLKFMIFNQWGQKVFETANNGEGWDGKVGGKVQPSGVYIYVCQAKLNNGAEVTKKGSVNLIR
jgi:gliding motility-associated-like protein